VCRRSGGTPSSLRARTAPRAAGRTTTWRRRSRGRRVPLSRARAPPAVAPGGPRRTAGLCGRGARPVPLLYLRKSTVLSPTPRGPQAAAAADDAAHFTCVQTNVHPCPRRPAACSAPSAKPLPRARPLRRQAAGRAQIKGLPPPLPPSPCTNWTRLVLSPVLSGHAWARADQGPGVCRVPRGGHGRGPPPRALPGRGRRLAPRRPPGVSARHPPARALTRARAAPPRVQGPRRRGTPARPRPALPAPTPPLPLGGECKVTKGLYRDAGRAAGPGPRPLQDQVRDARDAGAPSPAARAPQARTPLACRC
jgi:hypothetical protein